MSGFGIVAAFETKFADNPRAGVETLKAFVGRMLMSPVWN